MLKIHLERVQHFWKELLLAYLGVVSGGRMPAISPLLGRSEQLHLRQKNKLGLLRHQSARHTHWVLKTCLPHDEIKMLTSAQCQGHLNSQ